MQVEDLGTGESYLGRARGLRIEGILDQRRELKTVQILLDLQWGYLPVNPW